ncbi:hypothetical protein D3C81_645700 [compost metagenome]
MFANNGHVFTTEKDGKFQPYIWVQGMKYKLETVGGDGLDEEEMKEVTDRTATLLKIPNNGVLGR